MEGESPIKPKTNLPEANFTENESKSKSYDKHTGHSYHPGGNLSYMPNSNIAFQCGNQTYWGNNIRSVQDGAITYYFDEHTSKRLGHSVDNGVGIRNYFDDDGRNIGWSVTNGSITDYFGDCFECR